MPRGLWDLISPTRDWTQTPDSESPESYPRYCQGSPQTISIRSICVSPHLQSHRCARWWELRESYTSIFWPRLPPSGEHAKFHCRSQKWEKGGRRTGQRKSWGSDRRNDFTYLGRGIRNLALFTHSASALQTWKSRPEGKSFVRGPFHECKKDCEVSLLAPRWGLGGRWGEPFAKGRDEKVAEDWSSLAKWIFRSQKKTQHCEVGRVHLLRSHGDCGPF